MSSIKFENYVSPFSCATAMLDRTPCMSLEQVKEQYNLSFDPFESFGEFGFFIVLTPRVDLGDEDSPMFGTGWENWGDQYHYWLDWVHGVEQFDEGSEDNYYSGI